MNTIFLTTILASLAVAAYAHDNIATSGNRKVSWCMEMGVAWFMD